MNMYKIGRYVGKDKMSDLISDNYHMLLVLNRFGISLGFGNKSISEVCSENNVDSNTFLTVVNLLISKDKDTVDVDLAKVSLSHLLHYLKNSHTYFLDYKFPTIRREIKEAISIDGNRDNAISMAILNYFDEYLLEVRKHMEYEEETVFPYVIKIDSGEKNKDYSINVFSSHHENIDSKLNELKNIIIKYYQAKTSNELSNTLFDIFTCERDLASHNAIEDYILVPAMKLREETLIND